MALPKHLPALDGLRGAAVALVIASHAFPMARELPWTVRRFSDLGFYGVQLFFVVSCMTLANSWRRSEAGGPPSLRAFALRRLFRIAPAYFLAAAAYALLAPPPTFGALHLATFLTFTNGWSPALMPTVPGAWVGVPGGWSIEAEFGFYALFPLLATRLRGPAPAAAALLASLPLAWLASKAGAALYASEFPAAATDQFLYYWLPNQLPVFLCGLVAYEGASRFAPDARRLAAAGPVVLVLGASVFLALGVVAWPRLPEPGRGFLASHVIAAAAFAAVAAVVALRPYAVVSNRLLVWLGKASFSAYLIHFAVIAAFERLLPDRVFAQTGVLAALAGGVLFVLVLAATAAASQATYRLVELPAIRLGALAIRSTDRRLLVD